MRASSAGRNSHRAVLMRRHDDVYDFHDGLMIYIFAPIADGRPMEARRLARVMILRRWQNTAISSDAMVGNTFRFSGLMSAPE